MNILDLYFTNIWINFIQMFWEQLFELDLYIGVSLLVMGLFNFGCVWETNDEIIVIKNIGNLIL